MGSSTAADPAPDHDKYLTRAVVFPLDPTPAQERLLRSYCGAARYAHNWALARAKGNLDLRTERRVAGVVDAELTPSLSWSASPSTSPGTQPTRGAAPRPAEVSMHAFRSVLNAAAAGPGNFSDSRKGKRKGRPVGFPKFTSRDEAKQTIAFVEINHQLSWLEDPASSSNGHHIRLMLPQSTPDRDVQRRRKHLGWIHTTPSTRHLAAKIEAGTARIQKLTISFTGGRWPAALSLRFLVRPAPSQSSATVAAQWGSWA